jgi:hypothetical protein
VDRLAELEGLVKEATPAPWEWDKVAYIWGGGDQMVADIPEANAVIRMRGVGSQQPIEANAALIVFLRNHAEALIEVCRKAESLVSGWTTPDCDCPAEGHMCGWPKVVALQDALSRLKEGK